MQRIASPRAVLHATRSASGCPQQCSTRSRWRRPRPSKAPELKSSSGSGLCPRESSSPEEPAPRPKQLRTVNGRCAREAVPLTLRGRLEDPFACSSGVSSCPRSVFVLAWLVARVGMKVDGTADQHAPRASRSNDDRARIPLRRLHAVPVPRTAGSESWRTGRLPSAGMGLGDFSQSLIALSGGDDRIRLPIRSMSEALDQRVLDDPRKPHDATGTWRLLEGGSDPRARRDVSASPSEPSYSSSHLPLARQIDALRRSRHPGRDGST